MKSSIAAGFPRSGGPARAAALAFALIALAAPACAQDGSATVGMREPPAQSGAVPGPQGSAPLIGEQSNPHQVAAVVSEVNRLRAEGRRNEALAALEAALKTAPRDAQLRFLYGVTIAEAGRREDAIAVFEQLSTDFPELPEPYNNVAVMYAAAGDLDRARMALENAVRALPDYALAHENLGDLYVRLAARAWERAIKADPANRSASAKLAMAQDFLKRIAPAPTSTSPAPDAR